MSDQITRAEMLAMIEDEARALGRDPLRVGVIFGVVCGCGCQSLVVHVYDKQSETAVQGSVPFERGDEMRAHLVALVRSACVNTGAVANVH